MNHTYEYSRDDHKIKFRMVSAQHEAWDAPKINCDFLWLLNSFFPQAVRALNSNHTAPLWNPKQPPPPPTPYHISGKTVNFYLCGIQVSGPAQATCSNTLSSACTRHFHTPLCVHNPTKDWLKYMTVMYVCLLAHAPQITLHCSPASCLNVSLLHMYSIWSHLHSCTVCILLYFSVYV